MLAPPFVTLFTVPACIVAFVTYRSASQAVQILCLTLVGALYILTSRSLIRRGSRVA